MAKPKEMLLERRRFIRLQLPVQMVVTVPSLNKIISGITKNISADGLRFETHDKAIEQDTALEFKLSIPGVTSPIHAKGKVIWRKRLSLEDSAPYDIGVEFVEIEDDNKNTFLKFLCDLLYNLPKELSHGT